MSVSRDFIDSYSPEASHPRHRPRQAAPFLPPHECGVWSDNVSFRFPGGIRAFPEKRTPISGLPEIGTQVSSKSPKADIDLGFTRDRHSMSPKSAKADLGDGFPVGNATNIESRALSGHDPCNFRVNLIGKRSRVDIP